MSDKPTGRELLNIFRDAPWRSEQEGETFAAAAGTAETQDLLRLLELLTNRWLSAEPERHALRCLAFARLAAGAGDKALFTPYVRALRHPDPRLRAALVGLVPGVNNVAEHAE